MWARYKLYTGCKNYWQDTGNRRQPFRRGDSTINEFNELVGNQDVHPFPAGVTDFPEFIKILDFDRFASECMYMPNDAGTIVNSGAWEEATEADCKMEALTRLFEDCLPSLGLGEKIIQYQELIIGGLVSLTGIIAEGDTKAEAATKASALHTDLVSLSQQIDRATTERDIMIALVPYLMDVQWIWKLDSDRWMRYNPLHFIEGYVRPLGKYITDKTGDNHEAHVALRNKWTTEYMTHAKFKELSDLGSMFDIVNHKYIRHHWSDAHLFRIEKTIQALLDAADEDDSNDDDSTESGE